MVERTVTRFRYPDPPENTDPELARYFREFIRALEQNDVSNDAVFDDHATAIEDLTP
jgi:hypothetical protein